MQPSCDYQGYRLPSSHIQLDRVSPTIDAREFQERYIAARRPCILTGLSPDLAHIQQSNKSASKSTKRRKLSSTATSTSLLDSWLSTDAEFRDACVRVEQRDADRFGTGRLEKPLMSMRELVDTKLRNPKERGGWYLTTQYEDEACEDAWLRDVDRFVLKGRHRGVSNSSELISRKRVLRELWPPPLLQSSNLRQRLPLRPQLLRALVPRQINLWLGSTNATTTDEKSGLSSGLHHDYHDNLYVLLQGRKQFTLFAPSDAPFLYTFGTVYRVHSNGLITYRQNPPENISDKEEEAAQIRSDGAHQWDVQEWKKGGSQVEEVKEEEEEEDNWGDKHSDSEEEEIDWDAPDDFDEGCSDLESTFSDDTVELEGAKTPSVKNREEDPPSFSRIPVPVLRAFVNQQAHKDLDQKYPLLRNAIPCKVELEAGEMLYLPASWFHEVTSIGDPNGDGMHMALNYWMHPASTDATHVYPDDYWKHTLDKALALLDLEQRQQDDDGPVPGH